jgi:acyl-CoA oxidase
LLNLVADVLPDGQYVSTIDDPDQVSHPTFHTLFYISHIQRRGSELQQCFTVWYIRFVFQTNEVPYLQRFAAFLSPLTLGRVNIAVNAVYISKVCCAAFLFL